MLGVLYAAFFAELTTKEREQPSSEKIVREKVAAQGRKDQRFRLALS